MKLLICLCLVFAVAQAEIDWARYKPRNLYKPTKGFNLPGSRIVGGQEAKPHQFPWQVALLIETPLGGFFCGGSIISQKWIMTAAHCVDGAYSVQVIMGAHKFQSQESTQVRMVSQHFFTHETWDPNKIVNDIALVELPRAVTLNDNIQLVQLPSHSDASNMFEGTVGTISGWGRDSDQSHTISSVLRFVQSNIISNKRCSQDFGFIPKINVCVDGTRGKGSCNGDSGGPMVIGAKKQLGIVSFGASTGCEEGYSSVFTRVTEFLDWIQNHTDVVIS